MESQEPKEEKKKLPRGVFERPKGSGVYWINFYVNGKQRREKVGTLTAAKNLVESRRTAVREERLLPSVRNAKFVTFSELIDDALIYCADHKSLRDYEIKAEIVRKEFGARSAAALKPNELSEWLRRRTKTPATHNRYRAFLSLCYRVANENEKLEVNPASKIRFRKETNGRMRYFSQEEYTKLLSVIRAKYPEHEAEFVVSVMTGMRTSEQYKCVWSQVNFDRREITLYGMTTKNNTGRKVHLNEDAVAALRSVKPLKHRSSDPVFQHPWAKVDNRRWFNPCLKEAGIERQVWHCNRHTFCSWLAMKGATAPEIQHAAGHKTIAVSMNYVHLNPQHVQNVVDRIATTPTVTEHAPAHRELQHAPLHAPVL
jgi:integrase